MAYTGTAWDCTGASVKIATVELAGGGTTEVSLKEQMEERELLNFGNFPDPTVTTVRTWVEGSVSWQCDSATDFPAVSNTDVALLIDGDGLYFSGNVKIKDLEVKLGTDGVCTASFNFKSGTTYTLANTGGS